MSDDDHNDFDDEPDEDENKKEEQNKTDVKKFKQVKRERPQDEVERMILYRRNKRRELWSEQCRWYKPEDLDMLKTSCRLHDLLVVSPNGEDRNIYLTPPRVTNVRATVDVGCQLELSKVARGVGNAIYSEK
jgi:hypothetical protein